MKYRERFKECLINPTVEQSFERDPISFFSFYLSGRVNVLCAFAEEVIENLDRGFSSQSIDSGSVELAESLTNQSLI